MKEKWRNFAEDHKNIMEFLKFFIISNGVTVLQMILMPVFKGIFAHTGLTDINFQLWPVDREADGSTYYIFNYAAGTLDAGGGGGLAYFLAVQITMAIAQVINFFLQRNVTFKSKGNVYKAAMWYVIAYIIITLSAAALQGWYKEPIYTLFIHTWNMGKKGETIADLITMIINCIISFWVYYPILKIIFREDKGGEKTA
ncbi:GtrA family protein [Kineothrix sedimenti]|uniref:GtrA family protein n=1 Tax=Kineothrix sedimenti TaxID=3123317 RepID=A0ABZ3EWZ0_9FIRM